MGWTKVLRLPAATGIFSIRHRIQTGSGAEPASYTAGTEGSFPEGEANHSPPSNAEVNNAWSYTATPPPLHFHGVVDKSQGQLYRAYLMTSSNLYTIIFDNWKSNLVY
jgi:hypothetical protein